jgi:sulfatase modifying factor 1
LIARVLAGNEHPEHSVTFARPFALGKYLVTHAEFAAFVRETGYAMASGECSVYVDRHYRKPAGVGWEYPGFVPGDRDPVLCVSWGDTQAYIAWLNRKLRGPGSASTDGGGPYRLPSEAEWEYAAAGGSQQREYPWGSTDPGTDNRYAIYSCNYPTPGGICSTDDGITHIAPVGTATLGAGLWGQLDLAGDAWELVLDTYEPTYFDPCTDCTVTASPFPLGHALRGSPVGINSQISELEPTFRAFPAMGNNLNGQGVGFRCARTP